MDFNALPNIRRRTFLPLLFVHVGQSIFVAVIIWSLTLAGIVLMNEGTRRTEGLSYLVIVVLLMTFEFGLALYLIWRRRKYIRLTLNARQALAKGDAPQAEALLIQLLQFIEHRVDPRSVYYGLAVAAILKDERENAQRLLKKAGSHAASLELRTLLMLEVGLPTRAARLITSAIALNPRNAQLWVTLAACHQASGKVDEARSLLESAAKKWPDAKLIQRARKQLQEDKWLPDTVFARSALTRNPSTDRERH